MILRRILFFLAATTAFAVSAGVVVIALAYALYALVKPSLGPAGASAVVAGAAALLIALIGVILAAVSRPPPRKARTSDSVVDRVVEFVRDRPVSAVAAAIAAGLMAVRNPKYLGAAIRAFVEGRERPRR